ncbi:hypothetical protein HNR46_002731 [Haloferula luteola]|uniref:Uncharacterized protein n=1 Tax=Haloferula luteola TaxID=595692 RepID=A0A840V3B6_9BACT|nr:hypothetical protein [Haloferula luteola]MBB5352485.1 hypothetical protein [Haloferula luteola]
MEKRTTFLRSAAVAGLLCLVSPASATISSGFAGIVPGDDYASPEPVFSVLDADEAKADPTQWYRHGVTATARLNFSSNSFSSESGTFRVAATLYDETGSEVAVTDVFNGGGKAKEVFSLPQTFSVNLFTSRTLDFILSADPVATLELGKRYHFECALQRQVGGIWTTVATTGSPLTENLPAFHFTNTDPQDKAFNILTALTDLQWTRSSLIATDPDKDTFQAVATLALGRYDDFEAAPALDVTQIRADFDLHEAGGGPEIPLADDGIVTLNNKQLTHAEIGGRPVAHLIGNRQITASLIPLVQLESRSKTYELTVHIEHLEANASYAPDESQTLPAERLLHFNGELQFGSLTTHMIDVANDPGVSSLDPGGVMTGIQLSPLGGEIPDRPDLGFGSGVALSALLKDSGLAVVQSGSEEIVRVDGAGPVLDELGHLQVEFGTPQVTPSGPQVSSALLHFPQGLGVVTDVSIDPYHAENHWLFSTGLSLNHQIQLASPLYAALGANARMFDESHPLRFTVSEFSVDLSGTIDFVASACEHMAQAAYTALANLPAAQLDDPVAMRERFSNDGFLRFTSLSSGSTITVTGSAHDGSARTTALIDTLPGKLAAHFPLGALLSWSGQDAIEINEGRITYGSLSNPDPVDLEYDLACGDDPCTAGAASLTTLSLTPYDGRLALSPSGGVTATGDAGSTRLSWGWKGDGLGNLTDYTHRTNDFTTARFYMPGYHLTSDQNPLRDLAPYQATSDFLAPGILLLEGYDNENHPGELVRPETPDYRTGFGDYAGLTYTVENSGHQGASKIAGNTSDYAYDLLPTASKYYARFSGISGRHVATDGTFDPSMSLYGFDFAVAQFQLTFLSSENVDSWFDGLLVVPPPADFTQQFQGLMLTCTGDITGDMGIDPADKGEKSLRDWNSVFQPKAFAFEPVSDPGPGKCYPDRTLIVGATTEVAHIPGLLAGQLEFLPTGELGTAVTGNPAYNSRLGIPSSIRIDGPDDKQYTLHASTQLYFTDPLAAPDGIGQAAFAGLLDVPYFEDLKVHFLSSAQPNPNAPIYLCGGWSDGPHTFFNHEGFDETHRGFPPSLDKSEYLNPDENTSNAFLVHAEQSLFGVIPLDYPLRWSPVGRYFRTMKPDKRDLFILRDAYNQVDFLGPEDAEISFGAQYEGLPQISLANMAFDLVDEQLGAARALTDAATGAVTGALNDGIDDLSNLVSDNLDAVLAEALDGVELDVLLPLHARLSASYQNAKDAGLSFNQWRTLPADSANAIINEAFATSGGAVTSVRDRLSALRDANQDITSMLNRVDQALVRAILAIDSVSGQVKIYQGEPAIDPPEVDDLLPGLLYQNGGEYEILRNLVGYLMRDLLGPEIGPALQPLVNAILSGADEEISALLDEVRPALDRIGETLGQIRDVLAEMRGRLSDGAEIFNQFNEIIDEALMPFDEIASMMASLESAAHAWVQDQAIAAGLDLDLPLNLYSFSIFAEFSPEDLALQLRLELRDALLASDFMRQIQYALRQQVYDLELAMRSAVDSVFEEINRVIKDLIKESLGPLDDAINGLVGSINEFTGAGGIDGYAHVQGDSLKRLRIDAHWQMKIPDDLEFHAYVEILCYDSGDDFAPSACLAPGEKAMEVRIGVEDVGLGWISPELRASIGLKFAMNTTGSVYPKGIAGYFVMTGQLNFQSFQLQELNATVGFTIDPNLEDGVDGREAYLGASIRMGISGYEAAGAFFIGRTCTLEPLLLIDKDVAELLGSPPFTGGYVYGEVWVPVSEVVLGIPASCFFNISAGVGAGAFYFVEGPTFGGKMLLGVSGEALCVVSIKGEVRLVGLMQGGELRMRGKGSLTGKAGWCPFCLKFKKTATVTYQGGSWDVDL